MYKYSSSYNSNFGIGYIIGVLVVAIIFGSITKHINESKGYRGGFGWGFWLSIIGIIVVACKPDNRSSSQNSPVYDNGVYQQQTLNPPYQQSQPIYDSRAYEQQLLLNGGWRCSCGRINDAYTTYCVCGRVKDNLAYHQGEMPNADKTQDPKNNNAVSLIKQLAELHSQGILTDEEFSNKKTMLLNKIDINSSDDVNTKSISISSTPDDNRWIKIDNDCVRCPQCDYRMSIYYAKSKGKCPKCGQTYY